MKSYAGFKFLNLPPSSLHPPLPPSSVWAEAPWRTSATRLWAEGGPTLARPPHTAGQQELGAALAEPRKPLASPRKPVLPSDIKHATYFHHSFVGGRFGPLSPRENRKQPPPPSLPTTSFVPAIQLWKISEGHRSGSTLWCLYWLAPFPFYPPTFFFF